MFNPLATPDYTSLAPVAHFQTGLVMFLPRGSYLQSVAYEQLPVGDQKIYTMFGRPGLGQRTVVTGRNVPEDNGFTTSIGIPMNDHVTLTSYYNRSLRLHLDTASVGFAWSFRGSGRQRESLIDRALREAERGDVH